VIPNRLRLSASCVVNELPAGIGYRHFLRLLLTPEKPQEAEGFPLMS
jgi:hypothetical protein